MTAETTQEETRDSLYEKGFRDGQLTERSRHEKEIEALKVNFCRTTCDVEFRNMCQKKGMDKCVEFKNVFGDKKEV
jgi:hypothetical protein